MSRLGQCRWPVCALITSRPPRDAVRSSDRTTASALPISRLRALRKSQGTLSVRRAPAGARIAGQANVLPTPYARSAWSWSLAQSRAAEQAVDMRKAEAEPRFQIDRTGAAEQMLFHAREHQDPRSAMRKKCFPIRYCARASCGLRCRGGGGGRARSCRR